MKQLRISILALFAVLCQVLLAASNVNLTPVPKSMTIGEGELVLPQSFTILVDGPDSIAAEAERFAEHMNEVAGMNVELGDAMANTPSLFVVEHLTESDALAPEGYTLKVTPTGVTIGATTATGCYYAFQTIKKLLPPHVMAGVADAKVTIYALPVVDIADEPRFAYRGFMLDVSRHFFEMDELKRMIDVMAYYKMNRFHWHLTDDQGWRIEIKKYPKLTTVGAVRSDSYMCDFKYGGYYTKETYGPYFYTQDEARELVAYARERHIEIVPEVEFPGHACAAVAAYPEFSCWPNGSHNVQVNGGIFSDVLNVANPGAVRFAKDVLDEIADIFPYEQIHIGGDECPTSAWSGNAECQALMQEMGFSHIRELQSHFVRQLSDHLTSKEGDERRTVIMWNESLSAAGTNVEMIEGTGGMMMCWEPNNTYPTALKAAKMGMKSIITPQIPYYINRKHCNDPGEPKVAGHGGDNLQAVYNHLPIPNDVPAELHPYYHGIQGTFWTEHVGDDMLLEYLALPRLIAIAESAWSPQSKKNFDDFCRRVAADTVLLNYNKYTYARYYLEPEAEDDAMVLPTLSTDATKAWYRIVTANTGDVNRAGKCIELVRAGSPIIGTGNAQVNRLWSATVAEEGSAAYDYQLWALMENPSEPGSYALVNKAYPNGSVKPTPTASNNTARWDYDTQNRHYGFVLGDRAYGKNGDYYQYSIRSKQSASGMYMNMAAGGQQYSINLWNDPSDGNSGIWIFKPIAVAEEPTEVDYPSVGACVQIVNTIDRFAAWTLADEGTAHLMARRADYAADVWEIASSEITAAGQLLTLRNVATGRYMQGNAHPLALGDAPAIYTNAYNAAEGDFTLSVNGNALYPMPERATSMPHTVNVGGPFVCGEFMGQRWSYNPVQGGDRTNAKSKLVDVEVTDHSVYIKCRPRDWGHEAWYTPSYMENTYAFDGDVVRVDNRFVDFSGWEHPKTGQEVPAFYTISYLGNFWFYDKEQPWTGDELSVRRDLIFWPEDWPRHRFPLPKGDTETWCAWTDDNDWGIGLYVPGVEMLIGGRHAYNGTKEPHDAACNYVAPLKAIKLQSFVPLEYSYLIYSGSLADIRAKFTEKKDFCTNESFENYGK